MQLSDAERRELARIERHLAAEDPALARALSMPGRPWPLDPQQAAEAESQGDTSSVITLSLPIVGQQAPPPQETPAPPRRRTLGRWLMAAGAATVAAGLLTGAVAAAVGGFLVIAAGKLTADH
jgi:hypothetical protein